MESRFLDYAISHCRVFPGDDGRTYGVRRGRPQRALPVQGLVDELARAFYGIQQQFPGTKARTSAIDFLKVHASAETVRHVFVRSAWLADEAQVFIDTGGHADEVVRVSAAGWEVTTQAPVAFVKPRTAAELQIHANPVDRDEALRLLRRLAPVREQDLPILLALLLTSWLTDVPQPIVLFSGPRDSGKTSTARFLLSLVDPSTHLRGGGLPPNEATWKALATSSRVQLLDNVGHITAGTSDLLCRVASGGELTTRALYTDDTAHVTALQVPIWLTSVDAGVLREDLASRMVPLPLRPLDPSTRLAESELHRRQADARPRLTRALLDLLVNVLALLPGQDGQGLTHRMGDFELVLRCVGKLVGIDLEDRLAEHALDLAADVLDSDPIAQAVVAFCRRELPDTGDRASVGDRAPLNYSCPPCRGVGICRAG